MEQSSSWKAKRVSGKQEIPHILRNPKVHYCTHMSLPPCHYSQPYQSSQCPPSHFLKIHFNIALPSMPGSSKWSCTLRFHHQMPVYTSSPHTCYMPSPSHSSVFYHPNNILWGVQFIKLLIMWFFPLPCYPVPLRPKYLLPHPILKHPQPTFLPQSTIQSGLGAIGLSLVWTFERTSAGPEVCRWRGNGSGAKFVKGHAKKLFSRGHPQACGQVDQVCCGAEGLCWIIRHKQLL